MLLNVTGKAALGHPCPRGIHASLHIIDVRNWRPALDSGEIDLPMVAEPHPEYQPGQEPT